MNISSIKATKATTVGVVTIFAALAILAIDEELDSFRDGYLNQIRGRTKKAGRGLSLNLGGGDCEWKAPTTQVPDEINFSKTLLVGFPSNDKHFVAAEFEGLSGLPSKDDWDFVHGGYINAPFIKTNYPHQTGVWSWDDAADQVALVVQNIRQSLIQYSDIYWSVAFDSDLSEDEHQDSIDGKSTISYFTWRDQNILQEIYKWGWYLDFWLENGLLRDPYSHSVIGYDHWMLYNTPAPIKNQEDKVSLCHHTSSPTNPFIAIEISSAASQKHLKHGAFLGSCEEASKDAEFMSKRGITMDVGQALQDPNCDQISSGGCKPAILISGDRLRDDEAGPREMEVIGNMLVENEKMAKWIIKKEAWRCVWGKVLVIEEQLESQHGERPKFSVFMLQEMKGEVQRLVDKYDADHWTQDKNAKRLVRLLSSHLPLLQREINHIQSGKITLSPIDIFGPGERQALFGKATQ